jgi:glucokinase
VDQSKRPVIGIDVGGTKILGVILDPSDGRIIDQFRAPTPRHDPNTMSPAIAAVADHLIGIHGLPSAIGVGVPGLVDHAGVLHYGPNVPGVLNLDIAGDLQRALDLPVVAQNDASNAALAEHRLGAARGAQTAVIITQGTGIGGAFIVHGKLVRGANGFAGEPGHMLIDPRGHRCACGRIGCWETVSSGAGLRNIAEDVIAEGAGKRILEIAGAEPLRGEHVSLAATEGDEGAELVLDRFATWVALGLASLIALLDPEVIVLGGGLSSIQDRFIEKVRSRVPDVVFGRTHRPVVPIVPAELGEESGAVGAALFAGDLSTAG